MPTETAPQPVAAPAAVTPPPSQAAPKVETPLNTVTQKPISEAAHNLFKMLQDSGDPLKEADEPAPKKEDKPAAVAPVEAKPATEDKPVVKVSKKTPKRPELPTQKEEGAAPAPVATPAPTDNKWKDSLLDEEKIALEDAEFAERVNPKHKGLTEKMGKFLRDQKDYLEKHPEADNDDPEYKKILARAPSLTAADKREIAEARIEDRVAKRYDSKYESIEHELFVRDEEPKVEGEAQQIRKYLAFNALPKEMLDVLKEKGLPELQKQYADELEVSGGIINDVVADAKELLRITRIDPRTRRPLAQAAGDETHPKWKQHNRIAVMVNAACDDFQKNAPQSEQVRNGKWFVTREEWANISPAQRGQFWTFTNSQDDMREVIQRVLSWQPGLIAAELKKREESQRQRGWVRQRTPSPVVPAATPPQPVASAATPRPSPSPAPSSTLSGQLSPGQMLARRLSGTGE